MPAFLAQPSNPCSTLKAPAHEAPCPHFSCPDRADPIAPLPLVRQPARLPPSLAAYLVCRNAPLQRDHDLHGAAGSETASDVETVHVRRALQQRWLRRHVRAGADTQHLQAVIGAEAEY